MPAEIVNLICSVAASNAVLGIRRENNEKIYTELVKIARVQSVKGSNAIEGIVTTDARIKEIVEGNSAPLTCREQEFPHHLYRWRDELRSARHFLIFASHGYIISL